MTRTTPVLSTLTCLAIALAAFGAINPFLLQSAESKAAPDVLVNDKPISREGRATSFAPVIKKVAPCVVNIYSTKLVKQEDLRSNPLFQDPFFRRYFGGGDDDSNERNERPRRPRREQSLGSGVIISEDGYILTNNHVVEGADEVKVAMDNDHKIFTAKVIGADAATDVAVLKIDPENVKLPRVTLANSDQLEVGDVVLAIGNPFGVGQTVTMGIISAMGRGDLGIVDYEDFIQTDASINPGNSGGALIDGEGRLIGINTAIMSETGSNIGVGFAVPINMARSVMEQILKGGKVVRGYLGVILQDLTPDLAEQFQLKEPQGVIISRVMKKTPADKAGIKSGDVITEVNGKKVEDRRHLRLMISQIPPGTKTELKAIRDGKEKSFTVTLDELTEQEIAKRGGRRGGAPAPDRTFLEGVEVTDINDRARKQYEIPEDIQGALVRSVEPDSQAEEAGLSVGDVILDVNRAPVASADEAIEAAQKGEGGSVLLRVWSKGESRFVALETGKRKGRRR